MRYRLLIVTLFVGAAVSSGYAQPEAARPPEAPAPDFDTQVMPILTRAGCNAGACHGAAAGRGGFNLSLLGGDPAADYQSIVRQFEGRRVNFAHADQSLLLAKPSGHMEHGGGEVLEAGSPGFELVAAWLAAGAPPGGGRRLESFTVSPDDVVLDHSPVDVPLRATAMFNDGQTQDVTRWTLFTPTDPAAVTVDGERGVATVLRRGRHVLIARYLDRVAPITLTTPLGEDPVDDSAAHSVNFIDEYVIRALGVLRLPVAPPADDATFLRRVTLDLTGALPTPEEAAEFLAERSPGKRAQLVDRLLASDAFARYWAFRFAQVLRIHALPNDRVSPRVFHEWLRDEIAAGAGFDQLAKRMVTAVGDTHSNGPANFTRMASGPREQAELVSESLMGVRLACANCHNHPLDRWTQDDYHGLAAAFSRLDRGRVVRVTPRGSVMNPRTGEPAAPRIPGARYLDEGVDAREAFAEWLTEPDNPYFARATVNRLWAAMLGRGLVEPVDDLRQTNPATHPELLQRLAEDFTAHDFDIRHSLRVIANSATYARSGNTTASNRNDAQFYSHAYRRPLAAEVLADAVAQVTGVHDEYGDAPLGTLAVALTDTATPSESLDVLGRCPRDVSCEGDSMAGGLQARLHQINGEFVNRKVTAPAGRLQSLVDGAASNEQIIEEFYLRALSRAPSDPERTHWMQALEAENSFDRGALLEDFLWSLLNSSEFTTNH